MKPDCALFTFRHTRKLPRHLNWRKM